MSEITTTQTAELILAPMTRTEAKAAAKSFRENVKHLRADLLAMFERDAYKVLEMNWETFCQTELGMKEKQSQLSEWISWARVEKALISPQRNIGIPDISETVKVPQRVAEVLAKLPTPELQRQAYSEISTLESMAMRTPTQYQTELKHIVNRLLPPKETQSAPSQKPDFFELPATVEKPTLKPTFTPEPQAEPEEEIELELPDVGETREAIETASATLTLEALKSLDKVHRVWMIRILRDYCEWAEASE